MPWSTKQSSRHWFERNGVGVGGAVVVAVVVVVWRVMEEEEEEEEDAGTNNVRGVVPLLTHDDHVEVGAVIRRWRAAVRCQHY